MFRILVLLSGVVLHSAVWANILDPTIPIYAVDLTHKVGGSVAKAKLKHNNLQLNAIIVTEQEKKAIINGRVVRIDDALLDGVVLDITTSKVIVRVAGSIKELFLFNENIKVAIDE
ncbi:MAG: hypothetical protein COC15_00360 [Legionellales bacterium]|nr:MAG: hypothetical protein COC15_00360 [Legionellales bacterium]